MYICMYGLGNDICDGELESDGQSERKWNCVSKEDRCHDVLQRCEDCPKGGECHTAISYEHVDVTKLTAGCLNMCRLNLKFIISLK